MSIVCKDREVFVRIRRPLKVQILKFFRPSIELQLCRRRRLDWLWPRFDLRHSHLISDPVTLGWRIRMTHTLTWSFKELVDFKDFVDIVEIEINSLFNRNFKICFSFYWRIVNYFCRIESEFDCVFDFAHWSAFGTETEFLRLSKNTRQWTGLLNEINLELYRVK